MAQLCSAERFETICDTFRPRPRELGDYEFGRFCRAWEQPRACPPGRDEAEFLRGWDDVEAEQSMPDGEDSWVE